MRPFYRPRFSDTPFDCCFVLGRCCSVRFPARQDGPCNPRQFVGHGHDQHIARRPWASNRFTHAPIQHRSRFQSSTIARLDRWHSTGLEMCFVCTLLASAVEHSCGAMLTRPNPVEAQCNPGLHAGIRVQIVSAKRVYSDPAHAHLSFVRILRWKTACAKPLVHLGAKAYDLQRICIDAGRQRRDKAFHVVGPTVVVLNAVTTAAAPIYVGRAKRTG